MQTDQELMEKLEEFRRIGGDVFWYESYQVLALKYSIYKTSWGRGFIWQDLMRDVFRNDGRLAAQIERLEKIDWYKVPDMQTSEWLRLFALLQPKYVVMHGGALVVAKKHKGTVNSFADFRTNMESIGQGKNAFPLFMIGHMEQSKAEQLLMHKISFERFGVEYLDMQRKVLPELSKLRAQISEHKDLALLLTYSAVDLNRLAPEIRAQYEHKVDYNVSPQKITKRMLQESVSKLLVLHSQVLVQADAERNPELVSSATELASTMSAEVATLSKNNLIRTENKLKLQIQGLEAIRLPHAKIVEKEKDIVRQLQAERQKLIRTMDMPRYYKDQPSGDPAGKATPKIDHYSPHQLRAYKRDLEKDLELFRTYQIAN